MRLNLSMSLVRNLRLEISIYGLLIVVRGVGKPLISMLSILWLTILKTNPVLIGRNLALFARRKTRSLNLKPRLLQLWVLLILSIRVCGAVWERNQGRSLSSFSSRQSGHGLVPFVATHSQESTREASSLSVRALPVERQTTSVETVRIPEPHQHSSNSSQLPRSEAVTTGESPDFDIEDEYSLYTDFDHDRFTENYFEYKQGQKDIIVKNRLKNHIAFWKKIGASQFILDTISNGFKIPFYSLPPCSVSKNNMSALRETVFVQEAISDLLDSGLIQKCDYVPKVVNPLTVSVQSNGKKRLILDLREVNKYIWKQKINYEDLRIALMYLQQGSWMIKFDICSAYHFIDIRLPDTEFLGFSFPDKYIWGYL